MCSSHLGRHQIAVFYASLPGEQATEPRVVDHGRGGLRCFNGKQGVELLVVGEGGEQHVGAANS